MSYRLIHYLTSGSRNAPHTEAYVVARTESMPRHLVRAIPDGPGRELPAMPSEPLFCYNVLHLRGEDFHVLSSVRATSTEGELIAYHFVLREEEKDRIVQCDNRATPAGIALLPELQHIRTTKGRTEPVLLPEEDAPLAGACPAAESCATWQVLSGSGENAELLLREPYVRGCVIGVPPGVRARDALRLLHESDALCPELGWGREFAVYCAGQQLPTARRRIICAVDSPTFTLARQSGFATLRVLPSLLLQTQSGAPYTPSRETRKRGNATSVSREPHPAPETRPASDTPTPSPKNTPVYFFAECSPIGLFEPPAEPPKKRHPQAKVVFFAAACLLLIVPLLFFIFGRGGDNAPPRRIPPHTPNTRNTPPPAPKGGNPLSNKGQPTADDTPEQNPVSPP